MENLKNIKVTGEISLQPLEPVVTHTDLYTMTGPEHRVILILGPTGAGKSSFVEALAGPSQKLSLSSDQLAGYTQHINAFRVVNANVRKGQLFVIDTPGFSDSKFSEKEILEMVHDWLSQRHLSWVRILYLVPINGTRLPGTQRKTLEMLKKFLESSHEPLTSLTFATTMWDMLHSEGAQRRGKSNFEELRDKQLKDFIDDGARIMKFRNTLPSAMEILDAALKLYANTDFTLLQLCTPQLYRDLYERIENMLLEKRNIEDDLAQPEAQTNIELRNILEKKFHENDAILTKFVSQFTNYGDPPTGFEDAAQRLHREIKITTKRPWPQILLREDSTDLTIPGPPAMLRGSHSTVGGAKRSWEEWFGSKH
ncbi:P-loop containing nucleoside triphosphate hydrolase protein [Panaeolus papilionaceus]|nr:P-loop containing nucleoside triphosphate hydrolase protein [Panaeolus papilionaceus]